MGFHKNVAKLAVRGAQRSPWDLHSALGPLRGLRPSAEPLFALFRLFVFFGLVLVFVCLLVCFDGEISCCRDDLPVRSFIPLQRTGNT